MITFCEAKQFNPFPELLFNFIGTINELNPNQLTKNPENLLSKSIKHIAPSLMISGKCNKHTSKIKQSLESRYNINILEDLFDSAYRTTFSKQNNNNLKHISIPIEESTNNDLNDRNIEDENGPF